MPPSSSIQALRRRGTTADAAVPDKPAPAIFISYASGDAEIAERLVVALEERGLPCWIAARDIPLGAEYQGCIVQAIETAEVMLLLLSRNASASKEVPKETSLASALNRIIVPVLIDGAEVTGALRYQATSAQRLDLSRDFEGRLDHLARQLALAVDGTAHTERHVRRLAVRRRFLSGLAWPAAAALFLAGGIAAWQFAPQLRSWSARLTAPAAAPTPQQASPPVREAAKAAPDGPAQPSQEERVRSFILQYYAALSGPPDQAAAFLNQSLQDPVRFYDRPLPRRVVVAQQVAYMKRWFERSFVVRPESFAVTCPQYGSCAGTGLLDYTLRSVAGQAVTTGAERFTLAIAPGVPFRLTSISAVGLDSHGQARR